jgi:glycosyl-4,4'-diaponeurosporenoate acyltransferase
MWLLKQIGIFLLIAGCLGICSHFIGEALPRRLFHPERFPFRTFKWEQNGKFYKKHFKIELWKSKMPDKSQKVKSMEQKSVSGDRSSEHLQRLTLETCVAEAVHWVLLLLSGLFSIFMARPLGYVVSVLYALSHVPLIMIQRYNRPRLMRLLRSGQNTGGTNNETAASVQQ